MKSIIALIGMALAIALAPMTASAQSGNVYNAGQLRGNVELAEVLQVRSVTVEDPSWQERAAGTAVGGALGAAIGRTVANKSRSSGARLLVAGLGAAVGGLAGNSLTTILSRRQAQEVVLRLPNGRLHAVVQPLPADNLQPGDAVRILTQRGQTRLIRVFEANPSQPEVQVSYQAPQSFVPHQTPFGEF